MESELKPNLKDSIRELYSLLDQEVAAAGPVCEISGRCCRFQEYGHRLYLSTPEAEILLEEGMPNDDPIDLNRCSFQEGNICTAREKRPLGCRVYFCDETYQEKCVELCEKYIEKMKRLHEEFDEPWVYQSLHTWFEEHMK